ncbi:Hypothetical protein PFREUD_08470 [Propionibacterium freudenreichii subsp. shermanii CIRM-BIA1]|jgi:hypothetical protein
MWV